jgi:apolipoprotein N-acyltransferase
MKGGEEGKYSALISERLKSLSSVNLIASGVQDPAEVAAGRGANFVLALGPGGERFGRYDKLHPVPFVDDGLTPNPDPSPVATPLGKLGVQICYDLAFEDGPRKVTAGGAEILISPTKDPMRWGLKQHLQHSDMSAARAVETGLWILRPATSGVPQIIDPLGEVRAELASGERGVLAGEARLRPGGTFYTSYGWLFGPLSMALTLALGLWALFPRRR